jgi:hypothetical protein
MINLVRIGGITFFIDFIFPTCRHTVVGMNSMTRLK